jgi:hypothetical protein
MSYDYSNAPPPRDDLAPIPVGTVATVSLHIDPGNAGEGNLLTRSRDGGCEMLAVAFTVVDGPHKGRKFWERMILAGTTDGHAQAADISRGKLKAILDSTLGLKPDDMSDAAHTARTVDLKAFEGATFAAKIGIEKGGLKDNGSGERWPDKNVLATIITPGMKEWAPIGQPPPFQGSPSTAGNSGDTSSGGTASLPIERPDWAS